MTRPWRGRSPRRTHPPIAAVVAALAVALVAVSCVAPPTGTALGVQGLRASLGDGGIDLTWDAVAEPDVRYEVQVASTASGWRTLPSVPTTADTFVDAVDRTTYWFQVRVAASDGRPASAWSNVASALYVDTVLPVVRIDTVDGAPILDRENYVRGSIGIDPNGTDVAPYSGSMGIRGRGNTTWDLAKKPYRIKLDAKSPIMGMPAEKDWVLLANAVEESQLRNWAAMEMSRATTLAHTPEMHHVELVLNGRYDGVYLLTEHTEVGADRVDITEMDSDDTSGDAVTGGYLLEIDQRLESNREQGFRTPRSVPVVVKSPDEAAPEQLAYVKDRVLAFETALFGPSFADPVNGFRPFVDMDSFIDHYLVQEVTRNEDAFFASTFFTKERGEQGFRFGPVWDFDRSLGSHGPVVLPVTGWQARARGPWMPRAFEDPTFEAQVRQRWDELAPEFAAVADRVVAKGAGLRQAIDNDAARWGYRLDPTDDPSWLRTWILQRIAWIDQELG